MSGLGELNSTQNSTEIVRSTALIVVESMVLLTLNVATFLGNLFVFAAIYRNKRLQTVTSIFVINLALSDILISVLVLPLSCGASIANRWVFGPIGCLVFDLAGYILAGVSLQTLTLTALNRYVCIDKDLMYARIFTKRNVILMNLCSWIMTITFAGFGLPLAGVQFKEILGNPAICVAYCGNKLSLSYTVIILLIYLVPCITVIPYCYYKVFRQIQHHNAALGAVVDSSSMRKSRYGVEESRITKLFVTVLVGFCLCWLPAFVSTALYVFDALGPHSLVYSNLFWTLPLYTSCFINPCIYTAMSKAFRDELVRILTCKW